MQFKKGDRVEILRANITPEFVGTVAVVSHIERDTFGPKIYLDLDGKRIVSFWRDDDGLRLLSPCADCGAKDMNDRPHECEAELRPAPAGMPESDRQGAPANFSDEEDCAECAYTERTRGRPCMKHRRARR